MAERLIASVLKTEEQKCSVGSNPTLPAILIAESTRGLSHCAHNAAFVGSNPASAILINNIGKEVKIMEKRNLNLTNVALFVILCAQAVILLSIQEQMSSAVYRLLMQA